MRKVPVTHTSELDTRVSVHAVLWVVWSSNITLDEHKHRRRVTVLKGPSNEHERSGAAEARWAHNPKVGGSKPPFAILLEHFGRSVAFLEPLWTLHDDPARC